MRMMLLQGDVLKLYIGLPHFRNQVFERESRIFLSLADGRLLQRPKQNHSQRSSNLQWAQKRVLCFHWNDQEKD